MSITPRFPRLGVAALLLGLSAASLTACGASDPTGADTSSGDGETVVVGSFAFPESEILAEIYAQALEAEGVSVETKFNIGPRQQTIPALQDGSINLIPEYNGNLLAYYDESYTERTTEDVDAALVDAVAKDKLKVLASAEAEDKDAYVVTADTAKSKGLTTIGDLSKLVPFALGANPQFGDLGYGIPGLEKVYGVKASDVKFVPIEDFGGPDTVKALVDDSVQVADIYTTSPAIKSENLVVLEDPENMISSQNIIPLISESVDSKKIEDVLNAISAQLTTDDLIALRDRVEGSE
ncbi:MAG: ABC transporter substrate-binding protein, partial [Aeromicrobium sp.]